MQTHNAPVSLRPLGENRYQARIGAQDYHFEAQPTTGGGWLIALEDGPRTQVYVAQHGTDYFVFANGQHYHLSMAQNTPGRRSPNTAQNDLTAQMPGQVMALLVAEGENVTQGQPLLILEAMKMETRITAPITGTVQRVLVQQGEIVSQGQMLIELTPA